MFFGVNSASSQPTLSLLHSGLYRHLAFFIDLCFFPQEIKHIKICKEEANYPSALANPSLDSRDIQC